MAKDSGTPEDQAAEVEGIIADGRKRTMQFALMKSKDGVVLKAHPTKSSDAMLREAKAAGGVPAVSCQGTLDVKGKVLMLSVTSDDVPRTLAKLAKRHFASLKVQCKVIIVMPSGEQADSDDEDAQTEGVATAPAEAASPAAEPSTEPPETAAAAPDATDAATGTAAVLRERIRVLVPQVKTAMAAGGASAEKFAKALQAAGSELATGGLERAEKLIAAVEKGLTQHKAAPAEGAVPNDNALRQALAGEFRALKGDLDQLVARASTAVGTKARKIGEMFTVKLDRDLKKATQVLSLMKTFVATELEKLEPTGRGGEGGATPAKGEGAGETGFFDTIVESLKSAFGGDDTADKVPATPPPPTYLQKIADALSEGVENVAAYLKDNARLLKLATIYPEAAVAAKAGMDAFEVTLGGDVEITPELLERAAVDLKTANTTLAAANAALRSANAMPKGGSRNRAIKAAQQKLAEAQAAFNTAQAYEKAAKGKKLLEEAISVGSLAPDAPRKLSGPAALELIKGAGRDPDLTSTALEAVQTGGHGEAVALNLGKVIDLKDTGFAAGKSSFKPEFAATYANQLVKMGGSVGPEYFARMDAYVTSGRQFAENPTNDLPAGSFAELEQKRSLAVGKALVGPDGSIDLDSDAAKNAVGDALFNPDVLRNARPALTTHLLDTVNFLKDPENGRKASEILQAVPEPSDPAAMGLVRRATGKGDTDAVAKGDVQGAIMASMLKPLDQGPVGSCFSTAPTRRMRETEPLKGMEAYASIAGTGKYKPPFGPEVAVVTNTPPGDDPIMRSWEYSLATSTAQRAASTKNAQMAHVSGKGLATLSTQMKAKAMEGSDGLDPVARAAKELQETAKAALQLSKLKGDVAAAFTFIYDPMDEIKDSNDGSSDRGRYVLKRINPAKDIRTKADYIEAMTEVALASLGIAADAPDATLIKDHVKSDAFINAVTQAYGADPKDAYLPWALKSGGPTDEATQTLHGDTLTQQEMTTKAGDPKPTEGARTKDVLLGFLGGMHGNTDKMVTIRTTGMHGFNALPNHPTLDKLKGDTPEARAANVTEHLLKPGEKLAATKLSPERAADMFQKEVAKWLRADDAELKSAIETGIAAHKPRAEMTPAELDLAIRAATDAASEIRAKRDADAWKQKKLDKGETVSDTDYDAQKVKEKTAWQDAVSGGAKSRMIQNMGAPEFVLADTNWGSGADHTFFVICPDPATGEPALWKKVVPPGTLTKAGRDWIDAEWAKIDAAPKEVEDV